MYTHDALPILRVYTRHSYLFHPTYYHREPKGNLKIVPVVVNEWAVVTIFWNVTSAVQVVVVLAISLSRKRDSDWYKYNYYLCGDITNFYFEHTHLSTSYEKMNLSPCFLLFRVHAIDYILSCSSIWQVLKCHSHPPC